MTDGAGDKQHLRQGVQRGGGIVCRVPLNAANRHLLLQVRIVAGQGLLRTSGKPVAGLALISARTQVELVSVASLASLTKGMAVMRVHSVACHQCMRIAHPGELHLLKLSLQLCERLLRIPHSRLHCRNHTGPASDSV